MTPVLREPKDAAVLIQKCSRTSSSFARREQGSRQKTNALPAFPESSGLRIGSCRYCGLVLIVDVVAVVRVAGKLNTYFCTVDPAQLAGQRNILTCDQYLKRLGHVSERHRRQTGTRQAHVFQFTKHTAPIVADQQADRAANFVARVAISSVVHAELIQVGSGAGELKSVHSANEWLPNRLVLAAPQLPHTSLALNLPIPGCQRAVKHYFHGPHNNTSV